MGIVALLIYIIALILGGPLHAQPQAQMSHCLTAAYQIQAANFKKTKKLLEQKDLTRDMPVACKNYEYAVGAKGADGFRISTEMAGETWSIDEKSAFVRLARAGSKATAYTPPKADGTAAAPATPAPAPAAAGTPGAPPLLAPAAQPLAPRKGIFSAAAQAGGTAAATGPNGERVPMAVMASDSMAPLVETPPLELPTLTSILNPKVNVTYKPEDEARMKLAKCFSKRLFNTKMCEKLFEELDGQCGKGGDKLPVMCVEYQRTVAEIRLDDCEGDEETWGKCELRAKQITKTCANPLKQTSAECRSLNKYLARTPSGKPNPVVGPPGSPNRSIAQADVGGVAQAVDSTLISLLKNVQTLPPSLRKILTLRPVSYELKDSRRQDIGFVAEEVEAIDTVLVNYSSNSQLQNVRYPQLTTLLTSGMQELYGMCKSDVDLNKELIRKVISLQDENAQLKEKLDKHSRELLMIKLKLGIK